MTAVTDRGRLETIPSLGTAVIPARDVLVWLPPGCDGQRTYPALYLQDGQNCFDATAATLSWAADEAGLAAAADGHPVILAAVPHGVMDRVHEYSPWPETRIHSDGRGGAYLEYLTGTVIPAVEAAYPVRRDAAGRGVAGSSLGGLISLYASATRPDLFGFCAALSPALDFGGGRIHDLVATAHGLAPRTYLDMGGDEPVLAFGRSTDGSVAPWIDDVRRMRATLTARGVEVRCVEEHDAPHHESAWRRRFPAAVRWFAAAAHETGGSP